jgi:hypothetical protein
MGHIQDRWYKKGVDPDTKSVSRLKTGLHGKGMRYKVRYLDPDGRELSKMYPDRQLSAAKAFLHDIESAKQQGTYLNPNAGKITFQNYAEEWLAGQAFKPTTRRVVPSRLKNQAYPFLGKHRTRIDHTHHHPQLDTLDDRPRSGTQLPARVFRARLRDPQRRRR